MDSQTGINNNKMTKQFPVVNLFYMTEYFGFVFLPLQQNPEIFTHRVGQGLRQGCEQKVEGALQPSADA